jgi:DNA-binding MarR family transcriptional regulator
MNNPRAKVDALTRLVLAIFRANGRLLAAGDELVAPIGLSSARYQVLGAIALAGAPLTVPNIARSMGLTRQGVQKQVDLLAAEGLLSLSPNPGHRRSPLVGLTAAGRRSYARADTRWRKLARRLTASLPHSALAHAGDLIERLSDSLDGELTAPRSEA